MALQTSSIESSFSDGEFIWTLKHLGLIFDSDRVYLKSKPFEVILRDGDNQPTHWQLEAYCKRFCRQSMLRVYVRLINLNNVSFKGRFYVKSFYNSEELTKHNSSIDEDTLRHNLEAISPANPDQDDEQTDGNDFFVGWAGHLTNYVTKLVHVKIRIIGFIGDTERIERPLESPTSTSIAPVFNNLDIYLQKFVAMLYIKLMENIRLQLGQKQKVLNSLETNDCSTQTDDDNENDVDWQGLSRRIILRLVEVIQKQQNAARSNPNVTMQLDYLVEI